MIEALESFYKGWGSSQGHSPEAFRTFLDRERPLSDLRGYEEEFYKNVRCGILHHAETTCGWRILKSGPLFDPGPPPTINAPEFRKRLEQILAAYRTMLRTLEWNENLWRSARHKMDAICDNCRP